jgi:hypothetical protein
MLHGKRWTAAVVIAAGLGLSGCASPAEPVADKGTGVAQVNAVTGSSAKRVTLTREAADRLRIRTAPVTETAVPPRLPGGPSATRKVVPYSALLYDTNGDTWVYAEQQPLSYVRQRITVDYVIEDTVVLSDGPAVGTPVVTVGAAELYGTEFNIGEPGHGE